MGTISQRFGDSVVHEIPPNGQGIAALMALGMLDAVGVGHQPLDGVDSVHLQIEAMHVAPSDLLHADYLKSRATLIDPAVIAALRARGHEVTEEEGNGVFAFGGAQLVLKNGSTYIAGSDPRKDGHAVAY